MDVFANVTRRPFRELAEEHGNQFLDERVQRLTIDQANVRAIRDGLIYIPPISVFREVSLAPWQTLIKDQLGRDSCYAFAAIAALEAAYRRQFGYYLNLSEQYAYHINKASELHENYLDSGLVVENNTSLWGFQGSSDIVDKMARFAVPVEHACRYLSQAQMLALQASIPAAAMLNSQEAFDAFEYAEGHIPTRARHACLYRVKDYRALPPNPTPAQIMAVISAGFEVVADIPGHCFLIIGYHLGRQEFIVKNSVGGNQYTVYRFDQPVLAGRYITAVHPPAIQRHAWWMGRWEMDHDGWRGSLVIRRWTNYRRADGESTKLGSYYRGGQRYDVNGTTFHNGLSLQFWIAPTPAKVPPGFEFGQRFEVHALEADPYNAAGITQWGFIDYGATLRRGPIPLQPPMRGGFDLNEWIGHWSLSVNGNPGRLDIWSAWPLRASYRGGDGVERQVTGGIRLGFPHILDAWVSNPPYWWPLYLCHSSWEIRIAAGMTTLGFWKRGVQAERRDRFAVYGAIRAKWSSLGAFRGLLGEPLTDELGTPDRIGRYNHFQGGSIYWTPTTGAFEVHGAIRDKWASMGWEASFLGYPVSDEMPWWDSPGGRCSHFQRGRIVWDQFGARVG